VSATIAKYPRASQTQSATLSDPSLAGPSRMVTDASGGLYVVDSVNNDIAYFAAGQTALTTTLSDPSFANGIGALLIDPSGNLWVSVTNSGTTERLAAVSLPNAAVIDETLPQSGYLGYVP
jgi:streptogramin lyase